MKIKYLAHSSFMITSDAGTRIITDPYVTGDGYGMRHGEIKESAEIVTVSHFQHDDHNNVAAVQGNPRVVTGTAEVKGIKFKGIACYHDDAGGKLRGENTIICFEVDGIRLCHLGDLGHRLSDKQLAELGKVDILFIPVGGYYTIDAKMATEVCNQLAPKVIMPMHYKTDRSIANIVSVDEFLRGKKDVNRLNTSEAEFKPEQLPASTQIIVLRPAL